MRYDWPTKDDDMIEAKEIISKYIDYNDGEPLGLIEIRTNNEERVDYKISDWLVEVSEYFSNKYGDDLGREVTQRVITNCILKGQTVH